MYENIEINSLVSDMPSEPAGRMQVSPVVLFLFIQLFILGFCTTVELHLMAVRFFQAAIV